MLALAGIAAVLIFLIRHFELQFLSGGISTTVYVGFIGLLFLGVGIYMGLRLRKDQPKTEVRTTLSARAAANDLLTPRETEVLQCIAEGMSNKEIAETLFVSENTIKKHLNNLYSKLEVNRRVQAIGKAREIGILS